MSLDVFNIHNVKRIELKPRAYSRPDQDDIQWVNLVITHRTLGDDAVWRVEKLEITCFTDTSVREMRANLLYEAPEVTDDNQENYKGEPA